MNTFKDKSTNAIYKELRRLHPILASDKPLAIGIHQEFSDLTMGQIRSILGHHTQTTTYLRNVKFGEKRYHLNGVEADLIQPEHREIARLKLNIRNHKKVWHQKDFEGLSKKSINKKIQKHNERIVKQTIKLEAAIKAHEAIAANKNVV